MSGSVAGGLADLLGPAERTRYCDDHVPRRLRWCAAGRAHEWPDPADRQTTAAVDVVDRALGCLVSPAPEEDGSGLLQRLSFIGIPGTSDVQRGITWLAAELLERAGTARPGEEAGSDGREAFAVEVLAGRLGPGGLPEVARVVGEARFVEAMHRSGHFPGVRTWIRDLILILGAATCTGLAATLSAAPAVAGTVATSLLTALAAYLVNAMEYQRRDRLRDRLAQAMQASPRTFADAVASVARELLSVPRATCFVVDDPSKTDAFSQDVVRRALMQAGGGWSARCLWVVLEPREHPWLGPTLGRPLSENICQGAWSSWQLLPFTAEEAGRAGERRDRVHEARVELVARLDAWKQSRSAREIALFRLVVHSAQFPAFGWLDRDPALVSELSRKEGSGRSPRILDALAPYFEIRGGGFRREDVLVALAQVGEVLDPVLQRDDVSKRSCVPGWAAGVVEESLGAVGLVSRADIALFWFRKRLGHHPEDPVPTSVLRECEEHLKWFRFGDARALPCLSLLLAGNEQVREEWLALMLRLIRAGVERGFLGLARHAVRSLVAGSRVLLQAQDECGDWARTRLPRRFLRAAWPVYVATGEGDLLREVLDLSLEFGLSNERAVVPGLDDTLARTYLRLLPVPSERADDYVAAFTGLLCRDRGASPLFRGFLLARIWDGREVLFGAAEEALGGSSLGDVPGLLFAGDRPAEPDSEGDLRLAVLEYGVRRGRLSLARASGDPEILHRQIDEARAELRTSDSSEDQAARTLLDMALRLNLWASLLHTSAAALPRGSGVGYRRATDGCEYRCDLAADQRFLELLGEYDSTRAQPVGSLRPGQNLPIDALALVHHAYGDCVAAWEQLGYADLRNRALLDRAEFVFGFVRTDPASADWGAVAGQSSLALGAGGEVGLVATVRFALAAQGVHVWASQYWSAALQLALGGGFDDRIVLRLARQALGEGGVPDDTMRATEDWLERASVTDLVVRTLSPRAVAASLLYRLLEKAAHEDDGGDRIDRLEAWVGRLPEEYRLACASEFAFCRLRHDLHRHREIDWTREIVAWQQRRESWLYPALLSRALEAGSLEPAAPEVQALLAELEGGQGPLQASCPVDFVVSVGIRCRDSGDERLGERCAEILERRAYETLCQWEPRLAVKACEVLEVFGQYADGRYQRDKDAYTALAVQEEYGSVRALMLGGAHLQLLRWLMGIERIPVRTASAEWARRVADDRETIGELASAVPRPLSLTVRLPDGGVALVREWLELGSRAFSDGGAAAAAPVRRLQRDLNEAARSAVGEVIRGVARSRPGSVLGQLVRSHQEELGRYYSIE